VTETPGMPGAPTSDRLQALLAAAEEHTAAEQRAVSNVLGEVRNQVASLSEAVRLGATDASVERLGGVVSTVVADLRTSTSLLGQRIEALSKRIDAVAADTAAPTEQAAVRLAALSADIAAQADTVDRMSLSLDTLSGFPGALAALQKDVAGLHDRLHPLAEVRSGLGDLSAKTAHSLESLKPQLDGLQTKLDAIGTVPDTERLRDAVVDALSGRLDKLEEAAERPVVGPEALKAAIGDMRAALEGSTGDRFEDLQAALSAVENRLGQVSERIVDVGDAAGGVPAIATDLARVHTRLDDLQALREQVGTIGRAVTQLQDDSTGTALTLGLAGLRDDVEQLGERITAAAPAPVEEIAALVSQRVADRLVETLAPRIADVVLTRVSAALVTQLGEALSPRVKADTEDIVRVATGDSERRILAHLDEAVLALAEALLRRRRGGRTAAVSLPAVEGSATLDDADEDPEPAPVVEAPVAAVPEPVAEPVAEPVFESEAEESVEEVLDRLNTPSSSVADEPVADVDEPVAELVDRPAVTSSLAPAPDRAVVEPPAVEEPPAVAEEPAEESAAEESVAEESVAEESAAEPVAEDEAEPVVTEEPVAEESAPEREPAKVQMAKPEPAAPPKRVAKPPTRTAAPPPIKKSTRPPTKPANKPILERTPDVPEDDHEPIRSQPPRPRPMPVTPRSAPPPPPPSTPPPGTPAPPTRPVPPVSPLDLTPAEPPKRKPWWRPGG
jgi:hypothetical protein